MSEDGGDITNTGAESDCGVEPADAAGGGGRAVEAVAFSVDATNDVAVDIEESPAGAAGKGSNEPSGSVVFRGPAGAEAAGVGGGRTGSVVFAEAAAA